MKEVQLKNLRGKVFTFISNNETSSVYLMNDGKFLKIFNLDALQLLKTIGIDIERKILDSSNKKLPNNIIKPEVAVYEGTRFVGTITTPARGINYNAWCNNLTLSQRANLELYSDVHYKLETILRTTPDIVYPDICTCDNIFIDSQNNNKLQLIDYDGFQVDNYLTNSISTTLGEPTQYIGSKKYMNGLLFTKELDKKSLTLLYFLTTFNIDLNKVGNVNSVTGKIVTLDDVFSCINLNDLDIMQKVWKLFNENEQNEWLGEDVFRLADQYKLEVEPTPVYNGCYLKRLIKK